MCNLSKSDEVELWHKCLGHICLPFICKTIGADTILGIPLLKIESNNFCGECLAGKQIKASHN